MARSDLAIEMAAIPHEGIKTVSREVMGVRVTDVIVSPEGEQDFGRAAGRYITIEGEPYAAVQVLLERALRQLIPCGSILVAGLGNPDVGWDGLGAQVVRRLVVGGKRRIFAVETDVAENTGIETAAVIRALVRETSASCVLAVDSLACSCAERIGGSVQLSDTGIAPGSGAGADRQEISERTVGARVVAVGVPMAAELAAITDKKEHAGLMVTSSQEPQLAEAWAELIAAAINAAADQ